jgi:hypothetical protein
VLISAVLFAAAALYTWWRGQDATAATTDADALDDGAALSRRDGADLVLEPASA